MRTLRHTALALCLTAGLGAADALALPAVFSGDPLDGQGKPWVILPGVALVDPGDDQKFDGKDDVINPAIVGDVDVVARSGGVYTPGSGVIPAPAASVAAAPGVVAGGTTLMPTGNEFAWQLIVSDGAASPAAGHPLTANDLDGRGGLALAYADLDGDGIIGQTDADGSADDEVELQEAWTPIGRRFGLATNGLAAGTMAVANALPASKGGLGVVLAGGIITFGIGKVFTAVGLAFAVWIIAGSLWVLIKRVRLGAVPFATTLTLIRTTPGAFYGLVLGHMGLGFVVAAITTVMTWQEENILAMRPGDITRIGGYQVELLSVDVMQGPNYEAERGRFAFSDRGEVFKILEPERRFYRVQQKQTTQTGIHTNLLWNLYVAIGEQDNQGKWTVRLYYHPLAPWLWFGGICMALGGFISLSDRRFRVGIPQRAKQQALVRPALATGA